MAGPAYGFCEDMCKAEVRKKSEIIPISGGGTGAADAITALSNLQGIGMKKIWKNVSSLSTFAPQTIPLTIGVNDYVLVRTITYNGQDSSEGFAIIKCGESAYINAFAGTSGATAGLIYMTRRRADVATTGITFGSGYYVSGNSQMASNDARGIPLDAYVIKGVQ